MNSTLILPAASLFLAAALPSQAATIFGLPADNSLQSPSTVRNASSVDEVVRVGNSATAARAVVFVFQLPVLSAGETFVGSSLSFTLLENGTTAVPNSTFSGGVTPTFNVDLYGLTRRASSEVLVADGYYSGTPDPAANSTLLQADFLTSGTAVGTVSFSGPTLDTYLEAQYAGGLGAGEYVFLRLNPDGDPGTDATNSQRYRISMADNTGVTTYEKITPQITIVPEPSVSLLAGLGALALLRRRRA